MIDKEKFIKEFTDLMLQTFPDRVFFLGIQGSYGREEETDKSDIDMVVLLDTVTPSDVWRYRQVVSSLPEREKLCGFFSGKEELERWLPSELFQFCQDTVPLYGNIYYLLDAISKEDAAQSVLAGACTLYHACCHNMIHGQSLDVLHSLYKNAFFILQAKYYVQTGQYVRRRAALFPLLSKRDQEILAGYEALSAPSKIDLNQFKLFCERLFSWAQDLILHGV